MVVIDLRCETGDHRFEGWFASRAVFDAQALAGELVCPICGGDQVTRMVTAARLARKGNQVPAAARLRSNPARAETGAPMPPASAEKNMAALIATLAEAQAAALPSSTWVGSDFANTVRRMASGDVPDALVHGQATPDEARALVDDGLPVLPLVVPFVPPDERH